MHVVVRRVRPERGVVLAQPVELLAREVLERHLRGGRLELRQDLRVAAKQLAVADRIECGDQDVPAAEPLELERGDDRPGSCPVRLELRLELAEMLDQDVEVAHGPGRRAEPAEVAVERSELIADERPRGADQRPGAANGDTEAMEILGIGAVADAGLRTLDRPPLPRQEGSELVDCSHFRRIVGQFGPQLAPVQ